MEKRIRILFLASTPFVSLLEPEFSVLEESLIKASFGRQIDLIMKPIGSLEDLSRYIRENKPNIVHFSGHGNWKGSLYVDSRPIPLSFFADIFTDVKDDVQCVVLNGCYSAEQADEIAKHVPSVIGTTETVYEESAVKFAQQFYGHIGNGLDIPTAFRRSRDLISANLGFGFHEFTMLPSEQSGENIFFVPVSLVPSIVAVLAAAHSEGTEQEETSGLHLVTKYEHKAKLINIDIQHELRRFEDGILGREFKIIQGITIIGEWHCFVYGERFVKGVPAFADQIWGNGKNRSGNFSIKINVVDSIIESFSAEVEHSNNTSSEYAAKKVKSMIEEKMTTF